jgi:hypothetical protein
MSTYLGRASVVLTAVMCAVASAPAAAALGGDIASVLHDHESLQATHSVTPTMQYDVHEGRTADGLQLREYVDRSGKVFAVTWRGMRSPDVGALLGAHAARYRAAARARHGGHHVLSIKDADLVVTVMRLPRGWQGQAYLPAAIPAGVNRDDLR